jgi:two-component system cell cycle sensor histidine kinase/response regulator CckA
LAADRSRAPESEPGPAELRRLLDLSRELFVVFDLGGEIRFLSRAWRDVLGYEPASLGRPNLLALVHEDDREEIGRRIRSDVANGSGQGTFVVRMIHRDGTERVVDWTWQIDEPGAAFVALGRDVTTELAASEHLKSAEARIASLINRMADPSMGLDGDGRVVYLNDAAVERFGRPRNDLLGLSLWDDLGVAGTRFESEYRAALADGLPRQFEEFATGRGEWIEVRVVPDREGFGITYRDVSRRHELEEQLRQSQKMEAIGQLAGGIAHDFNNLLTAIIGYAELLGDSALDPGDMTFVDAIRRAADRAATLTGQLLAFGRRQILNPVVLNANEVVAGIEDLVRRLVGEGITVQALPSPGSVRIRADAGQLDQILVNLAVNARDAMPSGGVLTIEVAAVELDAGYAATHPEVAPGPYVMIAVSDTGVGMTPAVEARIFEPFFTTKGPGLGTGLGLSTVFGIVKQSGGGIGVYSEVGRGTAFKVYLPRVDETPLPERAVDSAPVDLGGNETILLAEDEDAVRDVAVMALRQYGYDVLVAASGEEALEIAAHHEGPIHLLVSDVVMQGLSGRDLSNAIVLDRPLLRTLFVSGYTENTIVHHGVLEPGIAFLPKPFTPVLLARKVREVLAE